MAGTNRVTEAQFSILKTLWRDGPQTIRQLTAILYPAQTTSDYATVQKLLEQLEEKGCVVRDRSKTSHVFQAIADERDVMDWQLQQLADKLCDGSLTPVLMHLAERIRLSRSEREQLQDLLDAAKARRRGTRKKEDSE